MTNIEYICFLNETGYGQAAFDMIQILLQSNKYNVGIHCLNGKPSDKFLEASYFEKILHHTKKRFSRNTLQIYHCVPTMTNRHPRQERAVAYATFETFDPPSNWIKILNNMDAIICPSKFNYKIFAHAGITKPIFYIPHAIDSQVYNDQVKAVKKREKFTFLFFGTWKKRKGYNLLLQAFFETFKASDEVELLIKTDKINVALDEIEKIKNQFPNRKDFPSVSLERMLYNNVSLPAFLKSVNCLVMPTLGEGFGLPALQCMSLKIPVIVTNFSGCQDYANDSTCTLIEPVGFVFQESMDNISQFANKKWPYLTIESISQSMLKVYANYNLALEKAEVAYEHVQRNFTYDIVYKAFAELMETVYHVN